MSDTAHLDTNLRPPWASSAGVSSPPPPPAGILPGVKSVCVLQPGSPSTPAASRSRGNGSAANASTAPAAYPCSTAALPGADGLNRAKNRSEMTAYAIRRAAKSTSSSISTAFVLGMLIALGCALLLLLAPPRLPAQASNAIAISGGPIFTPFGQPAANAPIRVCAITATGSPCSTAGVLLYSDYNLSQPISNPTALSALGLFNFFTTAGDYLIQVQASAGTVYSYYLITSSGGGGSGITGQAANVIPLACTPTTLCAQSHINESVAGTTQVTQALTAENLASIGPRYDVTQFGAVGNGIVDDTAAIQSAFTTCYNNGGGTVEFPGPHSYLVSGSIYTYDTCRLVGERGQYITGSTPSLTAPLIYWDGPNTESNTASVTSATIINNQTAGSPLVTAMEPGNRPTSQIAKYQIQATAANSFAQNEWVELSGCTYLGLNNVIGQVASANSTSFTLVYNGLLTLGTYSETCTATQATVVFAFDSVEHEVDLVSDLVFNSHLLGGSFNTPEGVDVYYSGRSDSGNNLSRVWFESPHYFGAYYAFGGEDGEIEEGSRGDGSDYYQVYWRNGGTDRISVVNSQFGPGAPSTHGASSAGGAFLFDNEACAGGASTNINFDHMVMENDVDMTAGLADITMLACPTDTLLPQFKLSIHASGIAGPSSSTGLTMIQLSPPSNKYASINITDSQVSTAVNTTNVIVGVPAVSLYGIWGNNGFFSDFHYFPSIQSWGLAGGSQGGYLQPAQFLGDSYFQTVFQYNIAASLWLQSDTAFAALPSGTTLAQGQVLAPPAYFACGTGSGCGRYAIDVVQAAGTVGTLNSGSTTCSSPGSTDIITCTSATGMMAGQYVTTATGPTRISDVNATNPSAVLVTVINTEGVYSSQPISYTAPILGKEMQLLTKAAAAPTTGTWAQGDIVENSGASSGGTCYWVNVAAGTPGTWLAVACTTSTGITLQTNTVNNTVQTTLNLENTTGASGINFTNPSGGIVQAALVNSALTVNGTSISLGGSGFGNWFISSAVSGDVVEYSGTGGEITDTGFAASNVVQKNISNTFTGANTNDFSGTSQIKLPVAAGATTLANGELKYDTTNLNWHGWVNGADLLMVPLASGFTSGHCGQPTSSGGSWVIADTGAACGSGSGSAFSAITSGTNTTAAMVVGTGASLATSGSGTIAATTAAALAASPTNCSADQAPTGINASGTAQNCTAYGVAVASCTAETTSWSAVANTCYYGNATGAAIATLPSVAAGAVIRIQNINTGTVTASFGSNFNCTLNGSTTSTTTCAIANGTTGTVTTDGTSWYVFVAPSSTGGSGANTALSNLAAVAINTSLLTGAGSIDIGSTANPFRNAFLYGGSTYGTDYIELTGTPTSTRTLTLPDATDTVVARATTDTLTNKSIAGSEINSGTVANTNGGTGQNTSASTGVAQVAAGAWSVSTAIANATTATTQSGGDNSTKLATTAYVDGATDLGTTRTLLVSFGTPGGTAISTGVLGYVVWPYACTGISSYSITVDAGTATVKTWKIATGTAIPTTANSISTSGVSLSTGTNITSSTVTDFTTANTTAKDIFGIDLSAVSGVGAITFEIVYTKCTQ
jgi:hypothetical protein